jgi:hypothetical protein
MSERTPTVECAQGEQGREAAPREGTAAPPVECKVWGLSPEADFMQQMRPFVDTFPALAAAARAGVVTGVDPGPTGYMPHGGDDRPVVAGRDTGGRCFFVVTYPRRKRSRAEEAAATGTYVVQRARDGACVLNTDERSIQSGLSTTGRPGGSGAAAGQPYSASRPGSSFEHTQFFILPDSIFWCSRMAAARTRGSLATFRRLARFLSSVHL